MNISVNPQNTATSISQKPQAQDNTPKVVQEAKPKAGSLSTGDTLLKFGEGALMGGALHAASMIPIGLIGGGDAGFDNIGVFIASGAAIGVVTTGVNMMAEKYEWSQTSTLIAGSVAGAVTGAAVGAAFGSARDATMGGLMGAFLGGPSAARNIPE